MAIRTYNVSLEEEVVEDAKNKQKNSGGKLSPLINELLKKWCEENNK